MLYHEGRWIWPSSPPFCLQFFSTLLSHLNPITLFYLLFAFTVICEVGGSFLFACIIDPGTLLACSVPLTYSNLAFFKFFLYCFFANNSVCGFPLVTVFLFRFLWIVWCCCCLHDLTVLSVSIGFHLCYTNFSSEMHVSPFWFHVSPLWLEMSLKDWCMCTRFNVFKGYLILYPYSRTLFFLTFSIAFMPLTF